MNKHTALTKDIALMLNLDPAEYAHDHKGCQIKYGSLQVFEEATESAEDYSEYLFTDEYRI